jgi:hypothetical protein
MSPAAPVSDALGASGDDSCDAASKDPWAEALRTLPPEDQKQFTDAEPDMLGILKGVSTGFR